MKLDCRAVLLDIEGTVAPVSFVFDVMFPFVRANLRNFIESHWDDPSLDESLELMAKDAGHDSWSQWKGNHDTDGQQALLQNAVIQWMDNDAKLTGLKQLQGLIWRAGFENGELVATLFDDVVPALREWKDAGLLLYIYSSGSVGAQKLFFGHTNHGNLLDLFSGHFDTTTGNKKEVDSYRAIAKQMDLPAEEIVFVSDVIAELDAAKAAGMQTVLRPDGADPNCDHHACVSDFADLSLQPS